MNLKLILKTSLLFLSLVSQVQAQPYKFYHANLFDANNITIPFTNVGSVDDFYKLRVPESNWQFMGYDDYIIYDQGIWIVGKINDEPRLALNQWNSSYSPGPIIDGKSAPLESERDSLKYRVYKISKGDTKETNQDLAEWPVDLGAPADENGNPIVYADQTLFTVYNAGNPDNFVIQRWQGRGDTLMQPLPLEIRQLVYGYNRYSQLNMLSNIVFFEWEIINKGIELIDSTFIALWTDIDFLNASNNFPAVDTSNQLGYLWYDLRDPEYYDSTLIPAIGYEMLYGPHIKSYGDSGWTRGKYIENISNLPLYSFHGISDDTYNILTGEISSVSGAWNTAKGLDRDGNLIIDDSTNQITKFPFSGDPVADTGWVYKRSYGVGGGAGFVMFSGPFDFAPGDTQWVMAALVPALGDNRFDSIDELRLNAKALHSIPYDRLVDKTVIEIYEEELPQVFSLSQNYPNPFNGSTTITYTIPEAEQFVDVPVVLRVYNILGQEVSTLVDEKQNPGNYNIKFESGPLSTGIYIYEITISYYTAYKKMLLLK